MRRSQRSPSLRLTNPLVEITLAGIHARLDTYSAGIATRFPDIAYKAFKEPAHVVIWLPLRKPAIADAGYTSQQYIRTTTQPYGDGATYGQRIEARLSNGMVLPFVTDNFLAPQQAHHLYLLFYNAPSRLEVHSQRLVLHRVPTYAYPQTQLPASEHIYLRCLFGNQRSLPLRQDNDGRDEFQVCQSRKVAEEHERFVEHLPVGIASPAWSMGRVRTQDVVKGDEVTVAHSFRRLRIVANNRGIRTNLVLRKCNAYLHIRIPHDLVYPLCIFF